jgi:hypothetical protein
MDPRIERSSQRRTKAAFDGNWAGHAYDSAEASAVLLWNSILLHATQYMRWHEKGSSHRVSDSMRNRATGRILKRKYG